MTVRDARVDGIFDGMKSDSNLSPKTLGFVESIVIRSSGGDDQKCRLECVPNHEAP